MKIIVSTFYSPMSLTMTESLGKGLRPVYTFKDSRKACVHSGKIFLKMVPIVIVWSKWNMY